MQKPKDTDQCPASSMGTQKVIGFSVEDILESFNRKVSSDVKEVVAILCDKRRTLRELIFLLQQGDSGFSSFPDDRSLVQYMEKSILHRYKKIFACFYGEWFVLGVQADPKVQELEQRHAGKEVDEDSETSSHEYVFKGKNALRKVVCSILLNGPLALGQLRASVRNSLRYTSTGLNDRKLGRRIYGTLNDNPSMFAREKDVSGVIPKLYARWRVTERVQLDDNILAISGEPKKRRVKAPQRDAIFTIMSKKWRIRGWTFGGVE